MKILYIAKRRRAVDETVIREELQKLGHEVLHLEERDHNFLTCWSECERFNPDFVLFHKLQIGGGPLSLIHRLQYHKVFSVSWTFDLHFGHPFRQKKVSYYEWMKADLNLLTDPGHDDEYKRHGIRTRLLRQGIADQNCYIGEPKKELECDVVLVGSMNSAYPERENMHNFLDEHYGDRFRRYGTDKNNQIRWDDLNSLYRSAKIVMGDSMNSPGYWSNRMYEIMGRGGFMITPYIEGLQTEFTPGVHYVYFERKNYPELKRKIDYYLAHPQEREKIAQAGFKEVKEKHKYSDRVRELISIVKEYA